jgi:hypothetical protein
MTPSNEDLHSGKATYIRQGGLQVSEVLTAFARKLTLLNDRNARMNLPIPALQDPWDVLNDLDGLVTHLKFSSARPLDPDTIDSLGAHCVALRLALARVEMQDPHSGGDAA